MLATNMARQANQRFIGCILQHSNDIILGCALPTIVPWQRKLLEGQLNKPPILRSQCFGIPLSAECDQMAQGTSLRLALA